MYKFWSVDDIARILEELILMKSERPRRRWIQRWGAGLQGRL